ncbi:hypothetical protein NESM_000635000 [Novymonas esmeraldas]|uniref:Uncharacterized protein n=1 Tax=Novymonas esmeraldas TaxID=1808958 RepID=A0AAW0ETS3_9TRYP
MSAVPPLPPPPGAVVPVPPASVPVPPAAVSAPVSAVKAGGVALDMSDLFGPPKNAARKSIPPWERKAVTPTPPSASVGNSPPLPTIISVESLSPPTLVSSIPPVSTGLPKKLILGASTGASYPSLSSLPPATVPPAQPSANAPVAVTRKSLPTASLITSPTPAVPLPQQAHLSSDMAASPGGAPPPPPPTMVVTPLPPAPPPPPHAVAAVVVPSSVAAPPPPPPASVVPLAAVAPASAPPPPVPVTAQGVVPPAPTPAAATAAVVSEKAASPPLPTPSPAAVAATARVVRETMRELRPHLPPPAHVVIAPHVVFQGKVQHVVVPPLAAVPPGRTTKSATVADVADVWFNRYDLQPSPSTGVAQNHGSHPLSMYAATSSTRRQWTSDEAVNSAKSKSSWRGAYWQHVDVHRYVARRYFGAPPPVEH